MSDMHETHEPAEPLDAAEEQQLIGGLSEEAVAATLEEVAATPVSEYARKYGGYVVAAAVVGAAAWWLYKNKGNRLRTPDGGRLMLSTDRHATGTVSAVSMAGQDGPGLPTDLSVSLPTGPAAARLLESSTSRVSLFALQIRGSTGDDPDHITIAHPLRGEGAHAQKYAEGVHTVASWLLGHFRKSPGQVDT
jgi:hypothetical protein